jgi:hypothetical protein
MTELTHFQEIAGMALDISDDQAAKIQREWPDTKDVLRQALWQWKKLTKSEIKGHELLEILFAIWKHRPTDL